MLLPVQVWSIGEFASTAYEGGCTVQMIVQYFEVFNFTLEITPNRPFATIDHVSNPPIGTGL
jgi:hypothetical protein